MGAATAAPGKGRMRFNYQVNPGAGIDSLEAKRPPIDNGLDVPDPGRYHAPDEKLHDPREK